MVADSEENSAEVEAAGGNLQGGHIKRDIVGKPALAGEVSITVAGQEALASEIRNSFETYGGHKAPK